MELLSVVDEDWRPGQGGIGDEQFELFIELYTGMALTKKALICS